MKDDVISRQAALALAKDVVVPTGDGTWYRHRCIDPQQIMELPSAQPEHNPDDERKIADLHKMVNYLLSRLEQRWIPVSERLPENREWVLGIFQEWDTGWINPIPFICDYVGKKTPITTQDNWLLKMVDEPHPYYEKLHCIAWMPLPEPWKEGENDA